MFKILGISEETECECCGKTNLKRTVLVGRLDADKQVIEVLRFGRDCAARATHLRRTGAAMEKLAVEAQAAAERAERNTIHEVGTVRSVTIWVIESVGSNGGSLTTLGYANGLKHRVETWAADRWPNNLLNVRLAR